MSGAMLLWMTLSRWSIEEEHRHQAAWYCRDKPGGNGSVLTLRMAIRGAVATRHVAPHKYKLDTELFFEYFCIDK